jgi:hypothetical protein
VPFSRVSKKKESLTHFFARRVTAVAQEGATDGNFGEQLRVSMQLEDLETRDMARKIRAYKNGQRFDLPLGDDMVPQEATVFSPFPGECVCVCVTRQKIFFF